MSSHSAARLHDRRRSVRVEVPGELLVRVESRSLPPRLRSIGASGFSIETREPFKVGVSYLFELQFTDSPIQTFAECLRCVPSAVSTEPLFEAGFNFEGLDSRAREIVKAFIDDRAHRKLVERWQPAAK